VAFTTSLREMLSASTHAVSVPDQDCITFETCSLSPILQLGQTRCHSFDSKRCWCNPSCVLISWLNLTMASIYTSSVKSSVLILTHLRSSALIPISRMRPHSCTFVQHLTQHTTISTPCSRFYQHGLSKIMLMDIHGVTAD